MPPGRLRKLLGVVVAVAGEVVAVGRQLVPLLAGDFTRLAADAERSVGEKAHLTLPVRAGGGNRSPLRRKSIRQALDHCKLNHGY